jgi:hypothetical protein
LNALADHSWKLKYTPDDGDLVKLLYLPALKCGSRYDRLTGFFDARARSRRSWPGRLDHERRLYAPRSRMHPA